MLGRIPFGPLSHRVVFSSVYFLSVLLIEQGLLVFVKDLRLRPLNDVHPRPRNVRMAPLNSLSAHDVPVDLCGTWREHDCGKFVEG
jgi:hypothetical protein